MANACMFRLFEVIGGCLADIWDNSERGLPMSIFSATVFMGPCLGPVMAGYLSAEGWRANYYLLLGISGSACVVAAVALPETYAVVLLRRRAVKLRKETGDQGYMTNQERFKKPLAEVMKESLIRPIDILVTEPIVFLFSLYLALIYALLYLLFFGEFNPLFEVEDVKLTCPSMQPSPSSSARSTDSLSVQSDWLSSPSCKFPLVLLDFCPARLTFALRRSSSIGMMLTFFTILPWQAKHYKVQSDECAKTGKSAPPEARLPSMMVGSIMLPIGFL